MNGEETAGLAGGLGPAGLAGATLALAAVLAAVALIDLRTFRIPDWLSLPLAAAGLTLACLLPGVAAGSHLAGAAAGYLLLAGIGAWFFRVRGVEGLGLGDAKLFAAAGAWLGWQALPQVLLIAALGGLVQAVVLNGGRRDVPLAFGPWIALGFWIMWLDAGRGALWPR